MSIFGNIKTELLSLAAELDVGLRDAEQTRETDLYPICKARSRPGRFEIWSNDDSGRGYTSFFLTRHAESRVRALSQMKYRVDRQKGLRADARHFISKMPRRDFFGSHGDLIISFPNGTVFSLVSDVKPPFVDGSSVNCEYMTEASYAANGVLKRFDIRTLHEGYASYALKNNTIVRKGNFTSFNGEDQRYRLPVSVVPLDGAFLVPLRIFGTDVIEQVPALVNIDHEAKRTGVVVKGAPLVEQFK